MGKQSTARKKAHQGEAKDEDTANGDSSSVQEAVHHQEDEENNSDFDVMVDVFKNRKDDSENQSAKDKNSARSLGVQDTSNLTKKQLRNRKSREKKRSAKLREAKARREQRKEEAQENRKDDDEDDDDDYMEGRSRGPHARKKKRNPSKPLNKTFITEKEQYFALIDSIAGQQDDVIEKKLEKEEERAQFDVDKEKKKIEKKEKKQKMRELALESARRKAEALQRK